MRKVYKIEGIKGFFTGLGISLLRDVPFSGVFFPIYELSKNFLNYMFKFNQIEVTNYYRSYYIALISGIAAVIANFMSCVITHPLDIIRTRVFFQHYNKDQT